MFRQTIAATALLTLFSLSPALAQEATDYLGVPGPITVGGTEYVLAWSSNPQAGYFKQEYLPEGADPQSYDSMVMVEFLATDMPLNAVVSAQVDMVNARKGTDPVANSAVFQNDESGELVLDFLLSAKDENGKFILEWNGYRYAEASFEGERGSLLFAISERSYGNAEAEAFLGGLRDFKAQRTLELTQAEMPELE
ncbi:MAG: hypothetical protein P0Y65_14630 [Candidatus Devosia phytovorans]|uniref:Chalcone isomerase domain-containing protein n=1 Tax=Candidatus Devosia phytovorans TaxID=3121372 RepID=A0AAJ5VTX3_9HYPH|nr:hypothetical protein [Devosia sp.]WEK03423.1 MAG: hypothetical protein P0Y65_14630 [Devosia sp.]